MTSRTGGERYLDARLLDPEYRDAYQRARRQIDQIDHVVRALDARREKLKWSKAELAQRAGMPADAVRRLFSAERPNPTLRTLTAIAEALGLDLIPAETDAPTAGRSPTTQGRSASSETPRRTA